MPTTNIPTLLYAARAALHVGSQGDMGKLLGSSVRTGQRWERREAVPVPDQLHRLAALLYPTDPALAAEAADHAGTTLEALGLRPSAPASPPPAEPSPSLDPIHIVDSVVCAAADAIQAVPDAVRPALRAAFRRARLLGLSLEAVDSALNPPAEEGKGRGVTTRQVGQGTGGR